MSKVKLVRVKNNSKSELRRDEKSWLPGAYIEVSEKEAAAYAQMGFEVEGLDAPEKEEKKSAPKDEAKEEASEKPKKSFRSKLQKKSEE